MNQLKALFAFIIIITSSNSMEIDTKEVDNSNPLLFQVLNKTDEDVELPTVAFIKGPKEFKTIFVDQRKSKIKKEGVLHPIYWSDVCDCEWHHGISLTFIAPEYYPCILETELVVPHFKASTFSRIVAFPFEKYNHFSTIPGRIYLLLKSEMDPKKIRVLLTTSFSDFQFLKYILIKDVGSSFFHLPQEIKWEIIMKMVIFEEY